MTGPAIIFDTECTGLGDDREIIEAAWIRPRLVDDLAGPSDTIGGLIGEVWSQRYQPAGAIECGAMAVHHILPGELVNCPPSSEFALPADIEYVAGHNVDFDWQAAGSPAHVKRICTLAMARWVWPDADSYSLSALLYMLLGPCQETRELLTGAHNALTDVENNVRLLDAILVARPDVTTWSDLYEFSEACRIPRVMPLGEKQGVKGLTLDEAVEMDGGFVDWCLRQDFVDDYLKTGLRQAIKRVDEKWTTAPEPDDRPACQRDPDCVLVAGHEGECDHLPF